MQPNERIILDLAVSSPSLAIQIVRMLGCVQETPRGLPRSYFGMVKVGPKLIKGAKADGRNILRELHLMNTDALLDIAFQGDPEAMSKIVRGAAEFGVEILTLSGAGGSRMLRSARDAVSYAFGDSKSALKILATALDSDEADATHTGIQLESGFLRMQISALVHLRAHLAQEARLDGAVVPFEQVKYVRRACGPDFIIVATGGKSIGWAAQAVRDGAQYVDSGTGYLETKEPVQVMRALIKEIEAAESEKQA